MGRKLLLRLVVVVVVATVAALLRQQKKGGNGSLNTRTTRTGETMVMAKESDPELRKAGEEARAHFDEFVAAFNEHKPGVRFSVKGPFATDSGTTEWMWVDVKSLDVTTVHGLLDNDPDDVKSLKAGDRVDVDRTKMSDWIVSDGSTMKGGYQVAVLKSRMKN